MKSASDMRTSPVSSSRHMPLCARRKWFVGSHGTSHFNGNAVVYFRFLFNVLTNQLIG